MIGYTGGVFDLFHYGHLRFLQRASNLCDSLIVGVTTDAAATKYKREPIIPEDQRMTIVEGIEGVDYVVKQPTRDKIKMWEELRFDVLFIGSNWANTDEFKKYIKVLWEEQGVETIILPYTEDISTSIIIDKIWKSKTT